MAKFDHIAIDLETLGTGYRAAMVAIGACRFTVDDEIPDVGETGITKVENPAFFYRTIDPVSVQKMGGQIDAATVKWWLEQSEPARAELYGDLDHIHLNNALEDFRVWYAKTPRAYVWGNGSNFDNRILREMYDMVDKRCPFHFTRDADMRTLVATAKNLKFDLPEIGESITERGLEHHALDDAIYQARVVQYLLRAMQEAREQAAEFNGRP